jgi:potassium efflux system protein
MMPQEGDAASDTVRRMWRPRAVAMVAILGFVAIVCATLAVAQQPAPPAAPAAETAAPAPAQSSLATPAPPSASTGLDAIKNTFDEIERIFIDDARIEDALVDLKRRLAPVREQLRDRVVQLDPRLKQIDLRLGQLGAPPASTGTEDPAISSERVRLTAQKSDVESATKQIKLLADRAGDLDDHINDRRRELFANRLFARSAGPFDRRFWNDLVEAMAMESRGLAGLMTLWTAHVGASSGAGGVAAALAILAGIAAAMWFGLRWGRRFAGGPTPRRIDKAGVALLILCGHAATLPALVVACVLVLRNNGLMPSPISDIGFGLGAATLIAGLGSGVAVALFAPGRGERRFIAWSDPEAESYAAHLTWATRAFGLAIFLNAVHRAVGAPVAPMIATGELLAAAILGIITHLVWRSVQADFGDAASGAAGVRLAWFRGLFWLIAAALAIALVSGYVGFAVFLVGRLLTTAVVGGVLAILIVFIDALLTELLAADTPMGRRVATLFGLTPRGLDLAETLLAAILRLVLIAVAVLLVMGYSGVFAEDVFSVFQRATWDYAIGGVSLSPGAILSAFALLAGGGLAIRGAQRWLATKFLPRTGLDSGLQDSILALFGYVALFAVLALALATLGIDLQKIALIAGALSVGIGFGLQSVVSNFVCGLILLAERPIRVGDWVVVKNEEGWVRRISVRATEIETFDRASVIIPNQEFITGVVKNWTHGNTVGRVVIKARVAYDSDPEQVRELLLGCATRHPQVLKSPPPAVYLMAFADNGIDFELRCLLGNVEQSLAVRTDLQIDILRGFRDARINIPLPVHEARPPGPLATPDKAAPAA